MIDVFCLASGMAHRKNRMAATRKAGPQTHVATFPLGEIGTLYTIASFAEVEPSLQQALLNQTACNLNCPNVNFKPNLKLNFTSISASKYIINNKFATSISTPSASHRAAQPQCQTHLRSHTYPLALQMPRCITIRRNTPRW